MNDEQGHPEDQALKIIITGKTRKEIAQADPPSLPKDLLLDDLFLGDELFDELGQLTVVDETAYVLPDHGVEVYYNNKPLRIKKYRK